jgi:hypothetical protein
VIRPIVSFGGALVLNPCIIRQLGAVLVGFGRPGAPDSTPFPPPSDHGASGLFRAAAKGDGQANLRFGMDRAHFPAIWSL